ncbi:MAG: cyclic nucleotide-binding domain-containing protein [Deltaproteobacteria bacterium]|nr:MAG: cyclic nucleotide-binding domain-containing protein [Deltaproteobacteria bacterium]
MSIQMDPEEFARSSKLFAFLDEAGRRRMMAVAREESFPAGHVVCREGEEGSVFWVILEGEVKVTVEDIASEKEVAVLGPGKFFGEISAVMEQPRTATVETTRPTRTLAFDRAPVMEILKDYPKVREIVGKVGLMRSEDTVQKLMSD